MTEISAALVKQLRDATSAGMMDCKRALQETDGDFDQAVTLLREKGMASAAKRADRSTSEGKVGIEVHDNVGALVAVGCETEPVSNNDEFLAYAEAVLHAVYARGAEAVAELEDQRVELAAKLGENIQVLGAKRLTAAEGELLQFYAHGPANKVGALVLARGTDAAGRAESRSAPDVRAPDLRGARRGARGARCRRAGDSRGVRRGPVETRERA